MSRGGKRAGSGRKPKATEIELIERLSPMEGVALEQLEIGVRAGDYNFIKLYMEYRYGRPKQQMDVSIKKWEGFDDVVLLDDDSK